MKNDDIYGLAEKKRGYALKLGGRGKYIYPCQTILSQNLVYDIFSLILVILQTILTQFLEYYRISRIIIG